MRLIAIFASFVALLAAAVLSVAVVKLRRELAATRGELAALRESCQEDRDAFAWGEVAGSPSGARAAERPAAAAPRLAPAALATGAGQGQAAAPLLASPEVKAEVKRLVAEQLADEQQQRQAVREQREQQRRERMATELGLSEAEQARFVTVLAAMQAEWQQLREQERSGEKSMAELRPQLAAVRQKSDQALRELLGEERMQKYQTLSGSPRGSLPGTRPPPAAPRGPE
jgi:predicted secreted protein